LAEIPLPVLFDVIPEYWCRGAVVAAVAAAAAQLGTLAVVRERDLQPDSDLNRASVVPLLAAADSANSLNSHLVMLQDSPDVMAAQATMKRQRGNPIVVIRVQATPTAASRIVELARGGAEIIHLVFDSHGREQADKPRHMRDVLREVHGALVKQGLRDQVTLVASGGIALAEHVAKAIICGADLVAIDVPLLLALECRLCGECQRGEMCQIALEEIEPAYGAQRIVNFISAWHQQLIEVLGAMGIREVRRLRGETGRAMFFEDLEREAFGRLFGKRKTLGPVAMSKQKGLS
jgi:hypothetical protein